MTDMTDILRAISGGYVMTFVADPIVIMSQAIVIMSHAPVGIVIARGSGSA